MRFLARLILFFFSNLIALLAAFYFVEGFKIGPGFSDFLLVAGVFTLINVFIRPILKLILSPIIIITFGLGIFLVNVLTLYLLDFLLVNVSIAGLKPLVYATLIISLVNIVIGISAKKAYKE